MDLLTKADVAKMLDVSVRTVENHIRQRRLPKPRGLGRRRYWIRRELEDYLAQHLSFHCIDQQDDQSDEALAETREAQGPAGCRQWRHEGM